MLTGQPHHRSTDPLCVALQLGAARSPSGVATPEASVGATIRIEDRTVEWLPPGSWLISEHSMLLLPHGLSNLVGPVHSRNFMRLTCSDIYHLTPKDPLIFLSPLLSLVSSIFNFFHLLQK